MSVCSPSSSSPYSLPFGMRAWLIPLPSEDSHTPIDKLAATVQSCRFAACKHRPLMPIPPPQRMTAATKSSSSTYGGGGGGGNGGGVLQRRQRRRDEVAPSGEVELAEDTCAGMSSSAMTTASLAHPSAELGGSKLKLYSMSSGLASIRLWSVRPASTS
uniref:Uncharacterized protein n=1 Tax=Oryza nivara TaxID=4536 RepID=A0A0E0GLJ4_ORYNI